MTINSAPTFAVGTGKVTTTISTLDDGARSVAVQPDGKIVVAGLGSAGSGFAVTRYNSDGSLDASFAGDGIVTTPTGGGAYSLTVQADGKIVVAGTGFNGIDDDFAVVRYNSDGSLDASFGSDGIVFTPVGALNDAGRSVFVQPDGKIVVAGFTSNGTDDDFALVRYNSDGTLDASFGVGGIITTPVGGANDAGRSVVVQADGKIVVAGSSFTGGDDDFALVRYNSDGTLDPTFGLGGIVTTPIGAGADGGYGVFVQADGKIVVAGFSSDGGGGDFALVRYNSDGSLDAAFGVGGVVTTPVGASADGGYSVTVQADGKILVAGFSSNGTDDDFTLVRYNSDGSLDASFGAGGIVATALGPGADGGYSVVVQANGKIVVAGFSSNGTDDDFALVRYNSDGSLDLSFNGADSLGGTAAYVEGGAAVVLDADVSIYDAELRAGGSYAGAILTLAREGGAHADDFFEGSGDLSALIQDAALALGGLTIGTVTRNAAGTLILTFNDNATEALVNAALRLIAYRNGSDNPPDSVTIAWSFSDGNAGGQGSGGALTASGLTVVAIAAVNDAPVTGDRAVSVDEDTPYTFSLDDFGFSDAEGHALAHVIIATLPADGVLLLNGEAVTAGMAIAAADIAAGALTFLPEINANGVGYASFEFRVQDDGGTENGGQDTSDAATLTIDVNPVNDAPEVTASSGTTVADEQVATPIDALVTVADVDNVMLTSATVAITKNFVGGQDVLAFADQNGITGSYDAATGILTLTGLASLADYQAALRSVTYTNISDTPATAVRTIGFSVSDGALESLLAERTLSVLPVFDFFAPYVHTASHHESGSVAVSGEYADELKAYGYLVPPQGGEEADFYVVQLNAWNASQSWSGEIV